MKKRATTLLVFSFFNLLVFSQFISAMPLQMSRDDIIRYTPGQIDDRWTDEIEKDYSGWLEDHMDRLPVAKEQIQELLKERTW